MNQGKLFKIAFGVAVLAVGLSRMVLADTPPPENGPVPEIPSSMLGYFSVAMAGLVIALKKRFAK